MTDNITLPRAVGERIRNFMRDCDEAEPLPCGEHAALAALDAALAEPDATREPATDKEIDAEWLKIKPVLYPMYGLGDFRDGFRAAERFHGIITKEDKT